jgi:RHS repeat-associated protein
MISSAGQTLTTISEYSPQGKIELMTHGNGVVTHYGYDPSTGRISSIHSHDMSQDIVNKTYTYSRAGDVKTIVNSVTNITYEYTYDHLHRLLSEVSSEAVGQDPDIEFLEFTYDETNAPIHAPVSVESLAGTTEYTYTATGNRQSEMTGVEATTYQTNYDNMISRIYTDNIDVRFVYNADNQRIKKEKQLNTGNALTTYYFGDDLQVEPNSQETAYVFAGNLRIAQITGQGILYFHKDHLGSTQALSDENGTVIDTTGYMPYGQDRQDNDLLQLTAYKFTDQEQDDGTGLYNYDARLYDPRIGMFIMADTIIPEPFNPQSLNRYAYCLNNPVRYTDPSGHLPGYESELHDGPDNGSNGGGDGLNKRDYTPGLPGGKKSQYIDDRAFFSIEGDFIDNYGNRYGPNCNMTYMSSIFYAKFIDPTGLGLFLGNCQCPSIEPIGNPLWEIEPGKWLFHGNMNLYGAKYMIPLRTNPRLECSYDLRGNLIDKNHYLSVFRGTPDQYPNKSWQHVLIDDGGIWRQRGALLASLIYHAKNSFYQNVRKPIEGMIENISGGYGKVR